MAERFLLASFVMGSLSLLMVLIASRHEIRRKEQKTDAR